MNCGFQPTHTAVVYPVSVAFCLPTVTQVLTFTAMDTKNMIQMQRRIQSAPLLSWAES